MDQYQYDANGRLSQTTTGSEFTTYDYDSQARLKQVQTPDHTIEYRHNALGNRVAKVKDGQVVERYLWQDKTTLLATYDGDGNLKQRFNYTLGHAPTSFTENGETYYLLTDHLGSPRVITDSAGQVVKAIEYDAYGNVIHDNNPTITIPFGFAGGLKDADTGLIRFGYRDYDPTTGLWTAGTRLVLRVGIRIFMGMCPVIPLTGLIRGVNLEWSDQWSAQLLAVRRARCPKLLRLLKIHASPPKTLTLELFWGRLSEVPSQVVSAALLPLQSRGKLQQQVERLV